MDLGGYGELSRRLGDIPNRLAVPGVTDISISSNSLETVDSVLPAATVPDDTSTYTAKSDPLTLAASNQDSLLIVLDSTGSWGLPESASSLENTECDLSQSQQTSRPRPVPVPPPRKSKQMAGSNSGDLTKSAASVTTCQKPVEGVSLQSSTVIASSSPMHSVQEARAHFIQSTTPALVNVNPRQSSLDQFDPLATGQLVVDGPDNKTNSADESTEENLLKEWNLDFSQAPSDPRFVCPGMTPQPRVMVPPSAVYASMPNLGPGSMRMRYPAYQVSYPSQAVQPWMMNLGVRHLSSGPAAAVTTSNRAVDSINKCATLPGGLASVPSWTQSSSEGSGSTVDTTQNTANDPPLDWTANIDILMRPHSMDLSSFASTVSNTQQSTNSQTWEKFE